MVHTNPNDEYGFEQVFAMLGIKFSTSRKEVTVFCPGCNKEQHFHASLTKNIGKCFSCGSKLNPCSYFARYEGIDNKEAHKQIMNGLGQGFKYEPPKSFEQSTLMDIKKRDKGNRLLLSLLPLMAFHEKALIKRGLSKEEVKSLGYKSYVIGKTNTIAEEMIKQGFIPKGLPGFFKYGDKWTLRSGKSGILIPAKDLDGNIQGFQIRRDKPPIIDGKQKHKYIWLSSSTLKEGTECKAFCHLAIDRCYNLMSDKMEYRLGESVLLTEGVLKADLIHLLTGKPVIAVPGVNTLLELEPLLHKLKELGVKRIDCAYDMDYLTNIHVQEAQKALEEMVLKAGLAFRRITWNDKEGDISLKGLDDYLMFHKRGIRP